MNSIINIQEAVDNTPVEAFYDVAQREGWNEWPDEARTLMQRATAPTRHSQRVDRCRKVAERVAQAIDPCQVYTHLIARVLLEIGWRGVGGPLGLGATVPGGNRSTVRVWPWSEVCGKGRAHASDGLVWSVALQDAQACIPLPDHFTEDVPLYPGDLLFAMGSFKQWLDSLEEGERETAQEWVKQIFDGARAMAGRRMLDRDVAVNDWAVVYSLLHHDPSFEEIKDVRIEMADRDYLKPSEVSLEDISPFWGSPD